VSAHVGLDVKLTSAIVIRVADAGYMHSWYSRLDGINYSDALQLASALILAFWYLVIARMAPGCLSGETIIDCIVRTTPA